MVRSGGRAQVSELWTEERFLAERLAASRRRDPSLRARSMRRDWSASQGEESRRCSKDWSMEREWESARLRNVWRRLPTWLFMWGSLLGFGGGEEGEEGKGQGRLAKEVGVWRRVSMVGECVCVIERERERETERAEMRVPVFKRYGIRTKDWVARGWIRGDLFEWGIGGWISDLDCNSDFNLKYFLFKNILK